MWITNKKYKGSHPLDLLQMVRILESSLAWIGEHVRGRVLEEVKRKNLIYWHVEVDVSGEFERVWAIRRQLNDCRPLIAERVKIFLNLHICGILRAKIEGKGGTFILYKTENPYLEREMTLTEYRKTYKEISPNLRRQVCAIYSYRYLMGMNNNTDSSILLRREGGKWKVYSIVESFPKKSNAHLPYFPDSILDRWFDVVTTGLLRTRTYYIVDMLGVTRDENERYELDDFSDRCDRFDSFLCETINHYDPDLIWMHGDIISVILNQATPG